MVTYKNITDAYTACAVIEGFADFTPSAHPELEAWAYLIANGEVWHLQGFYGRVATELIDNKVIDKQGRIDYVQAQDCGLL